MARNEWLEKVKTLADEMQNLLLSVPEEIRHDPSTELVCRVFSQHHSRLRFHSQMAQQNGQEAILWA